jgi:hypothetical protein
MMGSCGDDCVTVAILTRDKAHTLPTYLRCLEKQTWPKSKTRLYIRTNNNTDDSAQILKSWLDKVGGEYASVFFDESDLEQNLQQYGPHDWNHVTLSTLAGIRQLSLLYAWRMDTHYFVADCDNFILPHVLETLVTTGLPIVAPMLFSTHRYSNFFFKTAHSGYYEESSQDQIIMARTVTGLIEVDLVHHTYFIRRDCVPCLTYCDGTERYEFVIFSDSARRQNIQQYLDNRRDHGFITSANTVQELETKPWFADLMRQLA